MYEELIKRLREAATMSDALSLLLPNAGGNAIAKLHRDAAAAIEELSKPRWISVEERLPGKDGCYLVAVKNDHKRRYSKTAWFSHESWFARQDVTHWMPLPQPPKEET